MAKPTDHQDPTASNPSSQTSDSSSPTPYATVSISSGTLETLGASWMIWKGSQVMRLRSLVSPRRSTDELVWPTWFWYCQTRWSPSGQCLLQSFVLVDLKKSSTCPCSGISFWIHGLSSWSWCWTSSCCPHCRRSYCPGPDPSFPSFSAFRLIGNLSRQTVPDPSIVGSDLSSW